MREAQLSRWMKAALSEAESGITRGENPFGAAIYGPEGDRVAVACNTVVSTNNPSAHAEVNAITSACDALGCLDLSGHWLVCTAEPCPMCLSAAVIAGIRSIAFGANQVAVTEAGYGDLGITARDLAARFSVKLDLRGSILGNQCVNLLLTNRKRR